MRAIGFDDFGEPDVLQVIEVPTPVALSGEVLVRIHSAAVNPTDVMRRSGAVAEMREVTPPHVVGMDFAGIVEATGAGDVSGLASGDRVMGVVLPRGVRGAYARYIAVAASQVMRVPDSMTLHEAATLPMNALTALAAISALGLGADATIAVTGAAGVFGGYVIQFARDRGFRVVADASDADADSVRERGAHVVLPRGPGIAQRIRERFPAGVDAVVDGAVLDDAVMDAVADGGAVVTLRHFCGPTNRGLRWIPVRVRHHLADTSMLRQIEAGARDGLLTPRLAQVLHAAQAAEAHRRLARGGQRGRIVLDLGALT